jgi:hypothetical protein
MTDISSSLQDRLDLTWTDIGKKEDLQVLASVMTGILTIPHSSAPCERIFSVVRKNGTDQRTSLREDTLELVEALLVVKSKPGHYLDNSRNISNDNLSRLKSCYYESLNK